MSIISYLLWISCGLAIGVVIAIQPYAKRSNSLNAVAFAIAICSLTLVPPFEAYLAWGASALVAFAILWRHGVVEKYQLE